MEYYLIEAEARNPLPEIINWYNKINPKYINSKDAHKIKEGVFLDVRVNQETVYPDVMSDPYFLLSADAAKVTRLYEPDIKMIAVRLFCREYRVSKPYFLPILPVVDCLSADSEFIKKDMDIKRGIIVEARTESRALFQLAGIETVRVVIRLDLLESLLRREAFSLRVTEMAMADVESGW